MASTSKIKLGLAGPRGTVRSQAWKNSLDTQVGLFVAKLIPLSGGYIISIGQTIGL
jgi:hypothetical protein